jgi:hypothetical protein
LARQHSLISFFFFGFADIRIFTGWGCQPHAQPPTWTPGLRTYHPWRQGDPAIPPSTGYPFYLPFTTRMSYFGLFLSSGHHTENSVLYFLQNTNSIAN